MFGNKLANNGRKPIGVENYETVKEQLQLHRIPIYMEEVGGTSGRRVVFDCADGDVVVAMLNRESPVVLKKAVEER